MSKTRIIIIQLKEIIYTAIFIGLGILLVLLLLIMFRSDGDDKETAATSASAEALYAPGVYTTQFTLGSHTLNMEMTVDATHINSLRVVNLEESVTTMYPLMKPALEDIENQLKEGATLDSIALSSDNQYTQELLLDVVKTTLDKAAIPSS